jgi:pyruvate,water dikinase
MPLWGRKKPDSREQAAAIAERIRFRYSSFRELLSLNNESLELMAGLQEDLQCVPPRRDVLGDRVGSIFEKVEGVVGALERLTRIRHDSLATSLREQRNEIERYTAALEELHTPRLSAWLSEIHVRAESEVGGKAAFLGEIRNRLGLPVPDGFVLTTEAYRQYCGIPLWERIRNAARSVDLNDLEALGAISQSLMESASELALPRAVEVAITGRASALLKHGGMLAVRSSAMGEGGARTYAGQFLTLLNVPPREAVDAYRRVIAARFSENALFYRFSAGVLEVESPMAVLFLMMVPARAAGIMYTRDPSDLKSKVLWITATRGLGVDIASGRVAADLFLVSRSRPHSVVERKIVHKEEQVIAHVGGGVGRTPLTPDEADEPSIREHHIRNLAGWALAIEHHFGTPQDVEWVLDEDDRLWIVQSRPLARTDPVRSKPRFKPKVEPVLAGGRTVYPGRTSGPVFLAEDSQRIADAPDGSVVFVRRPAPEIVEIFPRIAGLVAEWGNIAGHSASLLREFQIPAVFEMSGAFDRLRNGDAVSLDSVQARLYAGTLWPPRRRATSITERFGERSNDPISRRLLTLNLLDPGAFNFRPAGCKSAHDVLRYCHEEAIKAMFEVNDFELERGSHCAKELRTSLPLNVLVLDLGGGLAPRDPEAHRVEPAEIVSRPFQALWKGISHPGVSWTREMPAAMSDLASVLAVSLTPQGGGMRPLGEKSYLLVADEYMNLNSRLAYHYSLVDACLSSVPTSNYISFRFQGGGATRLRRSLRACFLEACLAHYGFQADRRGDLVNAWFRKASADQTAERLDILGRLLACSSQLDMYMSSPAVMNWYVRQFVAENYLFRGSPQAPPAAPP